MDKEKLLAPFRKIKVEQDKFEAYINSVRPDLKRAFKKQLDQMPVTTVVRAGRKVNVIDGRSKEFRSFMLRLPNLLKAALDDIGYAKKAREYVANFDLVEAGTAAMLDAQNGDKLSDNRVSDLREFMEEQALSYLAGDGLADAALGEIKKTLFNAGIGQSSYIETVDALGDLLAGGADSDGAFSRVATLTARDSIYQYNGVLNEEASRQFGYNAFRYIGSVVDETRPQCERWTDKEYLLFSDLEAEIEWAFNNGSGMNPATTVDNFAIYRGGYNCRHIAVPTFYEPEQNTDENGQDNQSD